MRLFGTMGAEASFREEDFFGREEELSALTRAAVEGGRGTGSSFMIFGPPNIGKTMLLLKLRERVLSSRPQEDGGPRPFPFYFSFSQILSHPLALSQHFLQEYLGQLLRFFGDEHPPVFDPEGMSERLASYGFTQCQPTLAAHAKYTAAGDGLSALVNALSLPFSSGGGFYTVFLLDDFQFTGKLQGVPDGTMLSILRPYIKSGRFAMFLSGSSPGRVTAALKREGLYGAFQMLEMGGLGGESAVRHWEHLCARRRIEVAPRLFPRAAERVGGIPFYQRLLAEDIFFRNVRVADEIAVENLYALAVTQGKLNRYWREFFENAFPDRTRRGRAIRFLKRVLYDRFPLDTVEGALSLMGASQEEGEAILATLEFKGLLKADLDQLTFVDDPVLTDFLYWAFERGLLGKGVSQVTSSIVQARLARTASEAGGGEAHARRISIAKELMRRWDLREVPQLLFEYGLFREKFDRKGVLEVVMGMESEAVRTRLPKISSVSTGYRTQKGGPRFDFDLVAYGFLDGEFSEENLVVWAVDVVPEKALSARAVEHFENRCRLLALEKGLPEDRFRKWMLLNESADPAAVDLAVQYGIHLTHPTQLRLFLNLFGLEELEGGAEADRERQAAPASPRADHPIEYELVLPMKADSEMVAARVAETVAAFAAVDADTVDRIKMAIIEACINAFEHSASASGKVRLRYLLSPEKLELFVQDDGKGFQPSAAGVSKKNRGWGLKLIRELVDEVDIDTGMEGTVVHMVKYLETGPAGTEAAIGKGEGASLPEKE